MTFIEDVKKKYAIILKEIDEQYLRDYKKHITLALRNFKIEFNITIYKDSLKVFKFPEFRDYHPRQEEMYFEYDGNTFLIISGTGSISLIRKCAKCGNFSNSVPADIFSIATEFKEHPKRLCQTCQNVKYQKIIKDTENNEVD